MSNGGYTQRAQHVQACHSQENLWKQNNLVNTYWQYPLTKDIAKVIYGHSK